MEREMMIKEQQKQIDALKKLQKEQQASFISLKMGKVGLFFECEKLIK